MRDGSVARMRSWSLEGSNHRRLVRVSDRWRLELPIRGWGREAERTIELSDEIGRSGELVGP